MKAHQLTCVFVLSVSSLACIDAAAAAGLDDCRTNREAEPGLLATAWREIQQALELRKPTQAQRLAELRLEFDQLRRKKASLIETIELVMKERSAPGWLRARAETIPGLQRDISALMDRIESEIRKGGLLAGTQAAGTMTQLLAGKRVITLCALASIPFPLPEADRSAAQVLLEELRQETLVLADLDKTFAELIAKASPSTSL